MVQGFNKADKARLDLGLKESETTTSPVQFVGIVKFKPCKIHRKDSEYQLDNILLLKMKQRGIF